MFSNSKPSLPKLFQEIINNDNERQDIIKDSVPDFQRYRLLREIRVSLTHAAEKFLSRQKKE